MPRHRVPASGTKVKLGITVDPDIYRWIEARTGPGREFASVSHAFERAAALMRTAEETRVSLETGSGKTVTIASLIEAAERHDPREEKGTPVRSRSSKPERKTGGGA